jgi:hypothetical protein
MGENDSFGVNVVFTEFGIHLGKEAEVKEELRVTIRELEQTARDIHTMLQRVHRPGGVKETSGLTSRSRDKFNAVKDLYSQLDTKLPPNSYWKFVAILSFLFRSDNSPSRYSQLWQSTTSWIAFLASLTIYLETEALATKEQVEEMLGLATTKSVKLDIEEYLIGLTHLSNELSRLSVNCVTSEDYARPERIADFITSLNSGFRYLGIALVWVLSMLVSFQAPQPQE